MCLTTVYQSQVWYQLEVQARRTLCREHKVNSSFLTLIAEDGAKIEEDVQINPAFNQLNVRTYTLTLNGPYKNWRVSFTKLSMQMIFNSELGLASECIEQHSHCALFQIYETL